MWAQKFRLRGLWVWGLGFSVSGSGDWQIFCTRTNIDTGGIRVLQSAL